MNPDTPPLACAPALASPPEPRRFALGVATPLNQQLRLLAHVPGLGGGFRGGVCGGIGGGLDGRCHLGGNFDHLSNSFHDGNCMALGLCMTVKDEEQSIADCLDNIIDLFDDVHIVDTGSSDATPEILRHRYGIQISARKLSSDRCYTLADSRNEGFDRLETDWILCLDADERVDRHELITFKKLSPPRNIWGYFCRWYLKENDATTEDYKLSLFRKGVYKRGLVHDNVQADLRLKNLRAEWYDHLSIRHVPDQYRAADKRQYYKDRLHKAIGIEAEWFRYHWFLGYHYFRICDFKEAEKWLKIAFDSRSHFFPVECLNSAMVLAEIYARQGRITTLDEVVDGAMEFFEWAKKDFELCVNFRIEPWLEKARKDIDTGNHGNITAYGFAH